MSKLCWCHWRYIGILENWYWQSKSSLVEGIWCCGLGESSIGRVSPYSGEHLVLESWSLTDLVESLREFGNLAKWLLMPKSLHNWRELVECFWVVAKEQSGESVREKHRWDWRKVEAWSDRSERIGEYFKRSPLDVVELKKSEDCVVFVLGERWGKIILMWMNLCVESRDKEFETKDEGMPIDQMVAWVGSVKCELLSGKIIPASFIPRRA